MRKSRRRVRKHKNTAALKILVVMLVLALFGIGGMAVYAYTNYLNNNRMMSAVVITDRIHNNIYINGVHVGGMTREAAELLLRKEFIPKLQENTITVTADDRRQEFSFGEFGARYDFSVAVEKAYQYAKSGSLKERYNMVTALDEAPYHIEHNPAYAYDKSSIIHKLEPLCDTVNIEPLNASITRKSGQFILSDSQVGRVINTDITIEMIVAVLDSAKSGEVIALIDVIQPDYEISDLASVQSLIGTYMTKITPGTSGRNQNIITALSKINDVVLQPGEIFSTNKFFGPITYDYGYRVAPVIVGGQLEDGMGGGVCQVSSTLYNAVLFAELEVVERLNHSLKVTYVDYGFDATLAGDYIDFKFKNSIDSPVFIEAVLLNGTDVIINIYGRETRSPERTISFGNQLVGTIQPDGGPVVREDPSLPTGERVVKQRSSAGYRYNVYKMVYQNGVEVDKVLVNSSYYRPARGEVIVGTGAKQGGEPDSGTIVAVEPDTASNDIDIAVFDPAPIQPGDILDDLLPVIPDSNDDAQADDVNDLPLPDETLTNDPSSDGNR